MFRRGDEIVLREKDSTEGSGAVGRFFETSIRSTARSVGTSKTPRVESYPLLVESFSGRLVAQVFARSPGSALVNLEVDRLCRRAGSFLAALRSKS
jgi:hypothetical protein